MSARNIYPQTSKTHIQNGMFSSYRQLQDFTDEARLRYRAGEQLPWDFGLIEISEANVHEIQEIADMPKPYHNLVFKRRRQYATTIDIAEIQTNVRDTCRDLNLPDTFAVAGGFAFGQCFSAKPRKSVDIDIFPICEPDQIDYKHIARDLDAKAIYTLKTSRAITGKRTILWHEIQYILCPARTVSELLYSFDIPICQVAIWKGRLYATYEWVAEATSGMVFPRASRMSYNYHYRLKKYCVSKGIRVCYEYYGNLPEYFNFDRRPMEFLSGKHEISSSIYTYCSNPKITANGSIFDIAYENYKSIYSDTTQSIRQFAYSIANGHVEKLNHVMNIRNATASLNNIINCETYMTFWDELVGHDSVCVSESCLQNFLVMVDTLEIAIADPPENIAKLRQKSELDAEHKFWHGPNEKKISDLANDFSYFPADVLRLVLQYSAELRIIRLDRDDGHIRLNDEIGYLC